VLFSASRSAETFDCVSVVLKWSDGLAGRDRGVSNLRMLSMTRESMRA